MEIKNERELRFMIFGLTVGRSLDLHQTSLTSENMHFGNFDSICFELYKSADKLKITMDCPEERDYLSIEGAMRVSKQEARDAWMSMFEHSEEDK